MLDLCYETINFSPFIADQDADLPGQIRAAAAAGFPLIGMDIASIDQHRERGGTVEELGSLLREHGLRCFELQDLSVGAEERPVMERAEKLAEAAQVLGPSYVQGGATSPVDASVLANFRKAAAVLHSVGAKLAIEYLPFLPVCDIRGTRELLRRAEVEGARIVVDTWHFFHGPDTWADLEALPIEEIAYVQFDDHPELQSDDLFAETVHRRVLPGDGVFELERFCSIVRGKGYTQPVSVEILSEPMRGWSREKFARSVFESSSRFWS